MKSTAQFDKIAALDLKAIKMKLMEQESGEGWAQEQVDAAEFEYRRFLYLMKLFPHEQTAPLVDVDTFWHYHILDTIKYAADCEQIFGYFLHHSPNSGPRGEDDEAFHSRTGARMQALYEATFGAAYFPQEAGRAVMAQSLSAKSAWCIPAVENRAAPQPAAAKTAWCIPTVVRPTAPRPATAKTAWCIPTVATAAAPHSAATKTAWCIPTVVPATAPQPARAKTAWCIPTTVNPACLQGARAITSRRQSAAPNDRSYSPATSARAA